MQNRTLQNPDNKIKIPGEMSRRHTNHSGLTNLTNHNPEKINNAAQVDIWHYLMEPQPNSKKAILSIKERQQYESFIKKEHAERYLNAHIFLREVLAKYLNCKPGEVHFEYGLHGKPFLKGQTLYFSLSYRAEYALLALCRTHDVGVDLEKMRKLHAIGSFCDFSFTEEEKKKIFANHEVNYTALFTLWTFKEAYIKCTGTGLSADLTTIDLTTSLGTGYFKTQEISMTLRPINIKKGYKAAFAVLGNAIAITDFHYR